jgi:hypothetical protein
VFGAGADGAGALDSVCADVAGVVSVFGAGVVDAGALDSVCADVAGVVSVFGAGVVDAGALAWVEVVLATEAPDAPVEPAVTVVAEPDPLGVLIEVELGVLAAVELAAAPAEPAEVEPAEVEAAGAGAELAGALAALAPDPVATCMVVPLDPEPCGVDPPWAGCVLGPPDPCEPEPPEPVEPELVAAELVAPELVAPKLVAPELVAAEPPAADPFALPGVALAPPELLVGVELELSVRLEAPDEVSAATCAPVVVDAALRVVMAVRTLVELHTRPCGCSVRILLISPSIFEPPPIGPGG